VEELTKEKNVLMRGAEKTAELVRTLEAKLRVSEDSARSGLHDASERSQRMEADRRKMQQQVRDIYHLIIV